MQQCRIFYSSRLSPVVDHEVAVLDASACNHSAAEVICILASFMVHRPDRAKPFAATGAHSFTCRALLMSDKAEPVPCTTLTFQRTGNLCSKGLHRIA